MPRSGKNCRMHSRYPTANSFKLLSFLAVALLGPANVGSTEVSGYLTVTSDYVWRGVTQSDGDPAAQLGVDLNNGAGWYGGVWGAAVDINNGPTRQRDVQVNYYAGYSAAVSVDWTVDAHVVVYTYPGADSDVDYDYNEYSVGANYADRVWIEFSYSDDIYNTGFKTRNLEIYFEHPLANSWVLGGGAGYYDVSDFVSSGYGYWELGVGRPLGVFDVDLRYHDTNRWVPVVSAPERADSRLALSIRWSF